MQNEIRYFSMFTGVGGFERGFEEANDLSKKEGVQQGWDEGNSPNNKQERLASKQFTCVGMSEIDKYSNQVLKYKFPTIKNWGDCTKINPTELPDFDMLCGGFPCQAFSIAGKRRGFEDTRGTLFFEIARILKIKRPKIILLENVKGLLNHNKGETFKVILQTLDELGYEVQWMVLNSKFFGVPQNRERVFIIGNIRETGRSEILPFRKINKTLIGENQDIANTITQNYWKGAETYGGRTHVAVHNIYGGFGEEPRFSDISPTIRTPKGGGHLPSVARFPLRFKGRNQKNIEGDYSFTVDSCHTGGIREGMSIRKLTPVECCRLQGFPDDWNEWGIDEKGNKVKMSDTQRYKQMGNAVTTNVICAIGSQSLNKTKEENDG